MVGLTQTEVARKTGHSSSLVSGWESGAKRVQRHQVDRLDEIYCQHGRLVKLWLRDTKRSEEPEWLTEPKQVEEQATAIDAWHPNLVTGLLQCWEYAATIFRQGRPTDPPEEIDRLASLRAGRLETLNYPHITAVVPQSALTLASDDVRRAQASHLLELIDNHRVEVLVRPSDASTVGYGGGFRLLHMPDGNVVAGCEHAMGTVPLEKDNDVGALSQTFRRLLGLALPPSRSRSEVEKWCQT
ncbi:helix-turn-helix transcriptional regulator [Nocardiopsis rhodophaea]|uniref:helix-turn-helix domain-containing protein n=1 Tax=Nocardiopsis rhodophaea TaxID=280238 RepID=UPI0031DBE685